jgi:long-subunit acyl-CoA synthetase (AMP-forming)
MLMALDVPANEVGEIVGRGPITMPGYYKRPDLTNNAIRDGWLCSVAIWAMWMTMVSCIW